MIKIKRIYDDSAQDDGLRVVVDRLWPCGISTDRARLDLWLKEAAPRDALRKWFGHDRTKWTEFKRGYFTESENRGETDDSIMDKTSQGPVTLLYEAKDEQHNNAVFLREFIERRMDNS